MTATPSATATLTASPTSTLTMTVSATESATPTETPVYYPYNSAGEKAASIEGKLISNRISETVLYDSEGMKTSLFSPSQGPLTIRLNGVHSPDEPGAAFIDYTWDGRNMQGQPVAGGNYFINISITDEYGRLITYSMEVTIIDSKEYVRISVYNSAGETVMSAEMPVSGSVSAQAGAAEVNLTGHDGGNVEIRYAPGGYLLWDGRGPDGVLVANGVYELKIEQKLESGYKTVAAKSITILRSQNRTVTGELRLIPNPLVIDGPGSDRVTVSWSSALTGRAEVKIFNSAGELIAKAERPLSNNSFIWDLRSAGGQKITSGVYVVIVDGISDQGEREVKKIKLAVVRTADSDGFWY